MLDPYSYRKLMRQLLYLTNLEPELEYNIGILSQFIDAPRLLNFGAQRVLPYLNLHMGKACFFLPHLHYISKAIAIVLLHGIPF